MKALSASLITVLLALLPLSASPADVGKTLQNVKGSVTWGATNPPTTTLGPKSSTTISENDWAATGANSLATIGLPDSSQIVMDANSSVQMTSFNQTDIATARFEVVGKVRFDVKHPNGAKADYQFTTSTGQIAVRGTVGYIFSQPGSMQVVVVQASQPVTVTLASGQVFTLAAGQSLVVTTVAGAVTASVGTASQSMLSSFTQLSDANLSSLGVSVTPTTAGAAGAGAGAAGAGAGATGGIAAGAAGAAAAAAAVASSNNAGSPAPSPTILPTATPSPSPTPQPSTTSVPITVGKQTPAPKNPAPPAPTPAIPSGPSVPHFPGVRPTPPGDR